MLNYRFDWAIVTSGKYFDWIVSGLCVAMKLSAVSIALSFLLGLIVAVICFIMCFAFTEQSRRQERQLAWRNAI